MLKHLVADGGLTVWVGVCRKSRSYGGEEAVEHPCSSTIGSHRNLPSTPVKGITIPDWSTGSIGSHRNLPSTPVKGITIPDWSTGSIGSHRNLPSTPVKGITNSGLEYRIHRISQEPAEHSS
ncbi:hypothetical protein J6590_041478 [Homalodisca vitripennis]|nr:hypothetical protein J6590_041478 [Homalodisca vitripennis]